MSLQILGIIDRSGRDERLHLRATANLNLVYHVVMDTTYADHTARSISNKVRHAYWFQPREILAGDHVVLYTREGAESRTVNQDRTTSYFLYWGLQRPIWNNTGDCAVVFDVRTWRTSRYE